MKPTIIHILVCTSIIIGCKKEDPIGPDTTPLLPAAVTAVIGTAGGALTAEGFSLTVPPAAFSASETLKVAGVMYDNAFGTRALSGVYKLEGLPVSFSKPLEVRIRCNRTPSEGLYLALGRETTYPGLVGTMIFYSPVTATKDSNYFRATVLPPLTGRTRGFPGKHSMSPGLVGSVKWLLGIDQTTMVMSPYNNFRVIYPRYLETRASNLAAALEAAYKAYSQMGFDSQSYYEVQWPMDVVVGRIDIPSPLPPAVLVTFPLSGDYPPQVGMVFNEDALVAGDVPTIQRAAGQTFCNLFFTENDKFFWQGRDDQQMQVERQRIWPYYAIGAWAGEIFAPLGSGGTAPLNFRLQQMCPFDGLTVASGEKPWAHGLGLSPLMEYIADTYTPSSVIQLYYRIPGHAYAIDALKATFPVPEEEWWPAFLREYIQGKIYGVTSDDLLKDLSSLTSPRVFTIATKTDTLKTFLDTYADLSARLYRVNLRYSAMDTSSHLRFSVGPASLGSQYVGVILFGLKDKTLTYWQYANTVTVKQVKDLTAAGYDIVAAVVNSLNESPYKGSRTIELTVRKNGGTGDIPLQASLNEKIGGTYTDSYYNTLYKNVSYFYPYSDTRDGILSEHRFTASWNRPLSVYTNRTGKGSLALSFDNSSPPHLIGFSLSDTVSGGGDTYVWHLTSSNNCNIPGRLDYSVYVFEVTGTATRDQVGTLEYFHAQDNGYWEKFVSFSPNVGDLISIVVQKW